MGWLQDLIYGKPGTARRRSYPRKNAKPKPRGETKDGMRRSNRIGDYPVGGKAGYPVAHGAIGHHKPQPKPKAKWKTQHTNPKGPSYRKSKSPSKPKSSTRTTTYTGGGGGGGSSRGSYGSGSKAKASKSSKSNTSSLPKQSTKKSLYGDIYKNLDDLMREYAGIKIDYTPGEFDFRDFEGMDKYNQEARQRVESDTNANIATLGNQRAAANRAYEQALGDINLARGRDVQGVNADEQQALGRLQAMASNMGMATGMGALANNMGVNREFQNNRNQVYADYGRQQSENAMNRANAFGEVAAQEAAMRMGQLARTGELADQLGQAGWDRYMGERGQAFGEWGEAEKYRYQNALDKLEAQFGSLAGREGLLSSKAGLRQDERNYLFNELWRNKDFAYTAEQDRLAREYTQMMDSKTFNEDMRRFNIGTNQWDKTYQLNLDQLSQPQYSYNPWQFGPGYGIAGPGV